MSRYKIALDIDDVLAQFYPAMCKRFNQPCKQINIWDREGEASFIAKNFHIIENNKMFWLNLEKQVRPEDINFDVAYYITYSPRFVNRWRVDWLRAYNFPAAPVISTTDKVMEMRVLGVDVLVDDNINTLERVKKAGFIPIQYVPDYMKEIRGDLNPITHLSEIPELLNKIK